MWSHCSWSQLANQGPGLYSDGGDPLMAPSGVDSCHQFTEVDAPSSLFYCSHHLEREEDPLRVESSVPQQLPLTFVHAMYNASAVIVSLCLLVGWCLHKWGIHTAEALGWCYCSFLSVWVHIVSSAHLVAYSSFSVHTYVRKQGLKKMCYNRVRVRVQQLIRARINSL